MPLSGRGLGLLALAAVLLLIGYQCVIMALRDRRYLGSGAVPLFRAAMGDAAWLSRVRRRADTMMMTGASIIVRPASSVLPRASASRPVAADASGLPLGWAVIAVRNAAASSLNRFPRIRHRRGEAAIDRDRLAVDIGRLVAGEKQSHRREFVRLAGALQRIELADLAVGAALLWRCRRSAWSCRSRSGRDIPR